jgi:hypothetical protein
MSILNAIFFQLKCLFLGIGIDVENVADERAFKPVSMDSVASRTGRGLSLEMDKQLFIDSH